MNEPKILDTIVLSFFFPKRIAYRTETVTMLFFEISSFYKDGSEIE